VVLCEDLLAVSEDPSAHGVNVGPGRPIPQRSAQPERRLVVDDVLPPWRPRCVMIRGRAEALPEEAGPDGQPTGAIIRLHSAEVISWGLEFADE
jgi:hypothetical protein